MKDYNYILFDLDGTLADPGIGITNSVAFALKKYGIEVSDKRRLFSFVGPPLIDSFMKYYGFSKEKAIKAVEYYREYYTVKGIFENKLYEGIPQMLENLQKNGKKIVLATSKPDVFANKILKHFSIDKYFYFVAGATIDETRTQKQEVIAYALERCGITDKKDVIMVGDRKYDIIGAKLCSVDSLGVLYGYGSKEELQNAGAGCLVEKVKDLEKILIS